MQDFGPEISREIYIALERLNTTLKGEEFWKDNREIEKVLKEKLIGLGQREIDGAISLLAETAEVSVFMFEEWSESKNRTHSEIMTIIQDSARKLGNFIKKQREQLSLPKILNGEQDFGSVFITTELLRSLWKLGEDFINMKNGTSKSPELEIHAISVLEQAAEWVQYSKKRWGPPPNSECVAVSPIQTGKTPF